jgi:hypothetical protein
VSLDAPPRLSRSELAQVMADYVQLLAHSRRPAADLADRYRFASLTRSRWLIDRALRQGIIEVDDNGPVMSSRARPMRLTDYGRRLAAGEALERTDATGRPSRTTTVGWHGLSTAWMESPDLPCRRESRDPAAARLLLDRFFAESLHPPGDRFTDSADVAYARQVCATCPQWRACLDFAQAGRIVDGVWGGHTGEERRKLRRGETSPTFARYRQLFLARAGAA